MGGDLVAALGRATVDGLTLFGHNSTQAPETCPALCLVPGRAFALGEKVRTTLLELPQVRQTSTVLGSQPHGRWGYQHGVNAHGVAVGRAPLPTRLASDGPGLTGTDLVRLALERAHSARQAVDLLADLLMRHGQAAEPGAEADGDGNVFLVADATEAFAVECAGHFWVYQEVREVRAQGGLSTIRQDWDRIAHGLAAHACERGWWPADGSKLDFAAAVSPTPPEQEPERVPDFRRWGRATLLLAEQNGHIDTAFVRRLLSDHREGEADETDPFLPDAGAGALCRHPHAESAEATAASLVVALARAPGRLLTAWCAFGPPCLGVYFPVFLEGELPAAFGRSEDGTWGRLREVARFLARHPERRDLARETMGRLQARFDQEAEEFTAEGAALARQGAHAEVQRLATLFMEHCLERFEEVWAGIVGARVASAVGEGTATRAEAIYPEY
jgi:dipeptidase